MMKKEETKKVMDQLSEMRKLFMELAVSLREIKPGKSYENFHYSQVCEQAVNELARNVPRPIEIEGGGSSWWHVCPECHGAIDRSDRFCRHCGQAVTCE